MSCPDKSIMGKKVFIVFLFALKICLSYNSCVSSENSVAETPETPESETTENFWLSVPQPGSLVFIGVSTLRARPEDEIAAAREDAARKVSMYNGMEVSFKSIENIGTGFFDYYVDSNISLSYEEKLEAYLEKLDFDPERDLIRLGNSICIRFSYPASFPAFLSFKASGNFDKKPEWTSRQPTSIDAYLAGVGFARRQQRLSDTIMISTRSAAASIVSQLSLSVTVRDVMLDYMTSSYSYQSSRGKLSSFLVLETWIDPVSQDVWTLAIAKSVD